MPTCLSHLSSQPTHAQLRNAKVILPASSVSKKGAIKHSVDTRALGVSIRLLQLSLPLGDWLGFAEQDGNAVYQGIVDVLCSQGFTGDVS